MSNMTGEVIEKFGLRLKRNGDGTFTDQYGRVLQEFINKDGHFDVRPVGLDVKGANH